ncbi:hypothetical protein JCM21738_5612 [Mesobacillus boroniphilus JCM 21738]|uniref:Uncharacterized protein n=1 Tax=Mesobacillus boroniphilus JCM 21738 TaxID=1294265 RepID=W4RVP2_9BACI|nr:hypothetical protein JCM21738_5612 [Mesobacillus boroniphilus JCM 21738]
MNQSVIELSEEADEVRKTSENERNAIVSIKENFEQDSKRLISESKQRINELEELYTEKLRLSHQQNIGAKQEKAIGKQGLFG